MRTTLTLDDDITAKLKAEVRRTGRSLKQVVNETLREGLTKAPEKKRLPPFRVRTRKLGHYPGLDYDNIGVLLEQVEGPFHK
jgi:hypothetical protein